MAEVLNRYSVCLAWCSENYLVRWGSKGFPKEIDMLNNLKVVFTVSDHRRALSHCFLALQTLHLIEINVVVPSLKTAWFVLVFSSPPTFCSPPPLFSMFSFPCLLLYVFFFFLLSLFSVPCLCQSGPGEQGPEQRKDLSDLSDSESGQNGPERS